MDSHRLNRRITIKRRTSGQDAAGQPLGTWQNVVTTPDGKLWADIRTLSGVEALKDGLDTARVRSSIRVRYRTDIAAGMRVEYQGVAHDIMAVLQDDAGREYTTLLCEAAS